MLLTTDSAPLALTPPLPWRSGFTSAPFSVSGIAVNCNTPLARFGVIAPFVDCSSKATTPVTTAAAILVPDSCQYWSLPTFLSNEGYNLNNELRGETSDASKWPGATTSGFTRPSYHVGPLELYGTILSSSRVMLRL